MSQIPISEKGGIEPHLTFCTRCGGETQELTIGVVFEATLHDGRKLYYNRGQQRQALRSAKLDRSDVASTRHVEENEKLPASQPCKSCMDELKEHAEIVKAGGIYWKCGDCGQSGVIKKTKFADMIRKAHKIEAPKSCGVEFVKCKEHAVG